jgi:hypothetical protein
MLTLTGAVESGVRLIACERVDPALSTASTNRNAFAVAPEVYEWFTV